jgi:uncharacterized protein
MQARKPSALGIVRGANNLMEPRQIRNIVLVALAFLLIAGSRTIADFVIEYSWWKEVGQVSTWVSMLLYQILPATLAALLGWSVAMWAHSRGLRFAGVPRGAYPLYSRLVAAGLFVVSVIFVGSSINSWRVMAYVGSKGSNAGRRAVDRSGFRPGFVVLPVRPAVLQDAAGFVFTVTVISVIVFWASARGWQIYERFQRFRASGGAAEEFDPGPNPLLLEGATQTELRARAGDDRAARRRRWFFWAATGCC